MKQLLDAFFSYEKEFFCLFELFYYLIGSRNQSMLKEVSENMKISIHMRRRAVVYIKSTSLLFDSNTHVTGCIPDGFPTWRGLVHPKLPPSADLILDGQKLLWNFESDFHEVYMYDRKLCKNGEKNEYWCAKTWKEKELKTNENSLCKRSQWPLALHHHM